MESDRSESNLGDENPGRIDIDQPPTHKQPKKRFIGRKGAADRAGNQPNGDIPIEDKSGIQGE